ncbi:AcrR family transcriptional regulator [Arthrobacter pigmenti]|uniref:AcrR family transcriptional regulator n=1 Tax=Arthrobacter pigmenti TaxID=271432 RepID=A0A846RWC0_9MICC|nr:TetR/AcrR family transcriptional regulator [Arthrobacter pigmenti]NJC23326.1 AcrR family transcriptional regulator [Arthrobacter pigmenti]
MPRPASPLLSVDAIVDTAMALVDESGDFSFPKVAGRLGVSQSALYNHIDNREHIVELMRGRLFRKHPFPIVKDLDWDIALTALITAYRDGFAAHPRLVPMLVTQTIQDLDVIGLYEEVALILERAGLTPAQIAPAIATIDYLALGAALDLAAPDVVWSPPEGDFPALNRALSSSSAEERAGTAFRFSLDILISGIRAMTAKN